MTAHDQPPQAELEAIAYYGRIRAKVEHEDDLVNHRLNWLLMLQGFLFSAYGFSLTAEASSLAVRTAECQALPRLNSGPIADFEGNLATLRHGLVLVGLLSSVIALAGVLAAFRAIRDDEASLAPFPRVSSSSRPLLPLVIGTRSANAFGMVCGSGMPLLVFGAWIIVGQFHGVHLLGLCLILVTTLLLALTYVCRDCGQRVREWVRSLGNPTRS